MIEHKNLRIILRALLPEDPRKLAQLLGLQFWFGTFFKTTIPGDQSELKSLSFQVNTVPSKFFLVIKATDDLNTVFFKNQSLELQSKMYEKRVKQSKSPYNIVHFTHCTL